MTDFATRCEEAARELQERDATWLTAIPKMQRAADLLTQAAAMARDAGRVNYIERTRATIYASKDFEHGTFKHWVVVNESGQIRRGMLGETLRAAIDAAMKEQK